MHDRVDMHLILFENAARCLERMEADGGTPEAVARGSVLTASAKLIRSLHRVMRQWRWSYPIQKSKTAPTQQAQQDPMLGSTFDAQTDSLFADGLFTDWDNWPFLDPTELANMFPYDFNMNA
jgi:hypothetical protein